MAFSLSMRSSLFILCAAALLIPLSAAAQTRNAPQSANEEPANYKNPRTALLITVAVPGGGHIYAGETGTGLGTLFVSAAAIGAGAFYSSCVWQSGEGTCSKAPLYVGLAVHTANWIFSLLDAPDAARRHNRRLRKAAATVDAQPVATLHDGTPAAGVQVSVRF